MAGEFRRWASQQVSGSSQPSKIPSGIAGVYYELRDEITWMHGQWFTFRELFAESDDRIDFLNECAETFFYTVENLLFNEVQLALSKLADPAKTGEHENLSLDQLQKRLQQHGDPALALKCQTILSTVHTQCSPFRVRRHKKLAHLDLKTSLNPLDHLLPGVSIQMIEDALRSVREYMNAIEAHYDDSEWSYESFIPNHGAKALLAVLKAGLRYEELVQDGVLALDDWSKWRWNDA